MHAIYLFRKSTGGAGTLLFHRFDIILYRAHAQNDLGHHLKAAQ